MKKNSLYKAMAVLIVMAMAFAVAGVSCGTVYALEDGAGDEVVLDRQDSEEFVTEDAKLDGALTAATDLRWDEAGVIRYKRGSGAYHKIFLQTPTRSSFYAMPSLDESLYSSLGEDMPEELVDGINIFFGESGTYAYRIYTTNDRNDNGTGTGAWSVWCTFEYTKPDTALPSPVNTRWCSEAENFDEMNTGYNGSKRYPAYKDGDAIMMWDFVTTSDDENTYICELYKNGVVTGTMNWGSSGRSTEFIDMTARIASDPEAVWTFRVRSWSTSPSTIAASEWSEMSPPLYGNTMPEVPEYTLSGRVIKISEVLAYYRSAGERVVLQEVSQYGGEPLRNETTWRIGTPGSNLADGRYIIRDGDVVINDTDKEMYFISSDLMVLAGWMPVGNKVYFAEEYVEPGFRNEAYTYVSYRGKDWIGDAIVSIGENVITIDSISGDPSKAKNYDGSGTADVNSQPDTATGRWVNQDDGWWFAYSGGGYPAGTWEKINGAWYYFDGSGWMQTGWTEVNGTWYYMNGDGAMQIGWVKSGDDWYYLDPASGAMATGWVDDNGTWYYMEDSGAMKTGWVKSGNDWYYLNNKGAMVTGWVEVDDTWYYMEDSGAMATGWVKSGNDWYYLNNEGAMATGWVDDNGTWYYMEDSGAMKTGWVQIGKDWYYLNPASGAMMTGWVEDGAWYYMDDDGAMTVGWVKDGGLWYYMDTSGAMIANTSRRIDGKIYNFDKTGACTNPA